MKNILSVGCAVLITLTTQIAQAATATIREVEIKGNSVEIVLDSIISKDSIQIDYVRDIVQFSINNATIYPAKMLHASNSSYTKVFAYQYSPSLVRVRFTVENNAEQFKGKVKWGVNGKRISVQFSAPAVVAAEDERTLLQKITGAATVEKIAEKIVVDEKTKEKLEAAKIDAAKSEAQPVTNKKSKIAGAKPGPSVFRSFLAMFLVVGGLGMILIYVKRRNASGPQAKKVNPNSWYSKFLPKNMGKQKALMEVVATHVLGPKQSIVVMKIKGQQFVLAVTADNIQMITQLDADESELDLLDDPKVAASIGKMFGAPEASFNSMLKSSTGTGAIIARNAYAAATPTIPSSQKPVAAAAVGATSIRDQIKKRLESSKP